MADDSASHLPASPETRAAALAEEVRELRALLAELQSELRPAVQSSLRERSTELQRLGGEMAEQAAEADRLRRELGEAHSRAQELEREAERWRGAATRGVEEIAERARAAAERFEQRTGELDQALAAARARLEAVLARAEAAIEAREEALKDLGRARRRSGSLRARVLRAEARRVDMQRTLSWRITAPLRWIPMAIRRLLLGAARLRRRVLKR
jgi:chromosome segregation ATPase